MTVPHLMNCPHSDEGWCLECVVELGNENWRLRDVARDAADAATQHQAEVLRLRAALQKIADWDSNWGPFPENNEAWRAMVVVTAREAVPLGPDVGVEPPCLVGSNDGSNPLQLETGESMNDRPAVRDETAFPLVPCPLCGGTSCYVLGDGSTHRWWIMLCADCGADVAECRSDGSTRIDAPKPARWPAADEAWNEAGAHAAGLRAELAQARAELSADVRVPAAMATAQDGVAFALYVEGFTNEGEDISDYAAVADLEWLRRAWGEMQASLKADHCGDCTKVAMPCLRCLTERLYATADKLLVSAAAPTPKEQT